MKAIDCELPGNEAPMIDRAPWTADLDSSDVDAESIVDFFSARGWGDGLPPVHPTLERVEAMLAGGCREEDPDEVVAR